MSLDNIYSIKQQRLLKYGNGRWNIASGATRSGKTYLDIDFRIMNAILERKGKSGLTIMCGLSYGTIERNVIIPMRERYGNLIGNISVGSSKIKSTHVFIAGEPVMLFGAGDKRRMDSLRGSSVKYAYCDEVVTYSNNFFDLIKSRLDKPYSRCDCTCNPDNSQHWFKQFLDDDKIEKYTEHFTIDDNPFLDKLFINNLKKEYEGTVYYDRYILGKWVNAEGLVFPMFADSLIKDNSNYGIYFIQQPKQYRLIHLGLDLGETKSKTILTASGLYYDNGYKLDTLEAIDLNTIDLDVIAQNILDFCDTIQNKYGVRPIQVWSDNNLGLVQNIGKKIGSLGSSLYIDKVDKSTISLQDYIKIITTLLNNNKLKIGAKLTQNSLATLLYDDKKNDDSILDNGTCDVDSYDSFRYSIVAFIKDYNLT